MCKPKKSSKKWSRRKFLKAAGIVGCGTAAHSFSSVFSPMRAWAFSGGAAKTIIHIDLDGGCPLNISPIFRSAYYDKNPNISYQPGDAGVHVLSSEQGLHPALTEVKRQWDNDNLAVFNLVGYQGENRSHEGSSMIMESGVTHTSGVGGWMGRLACQLPSNPVAGIALSTSSGTLLQSNCESRPLALNNLDSLGEDTFYYAQHTKWLQITRDGLFASASSPGANRGLRLLNDANQDFDRTINLIEEELNAGLPVGFPNSGIGQQLRDAARIIQSDQIPCCVISCSQGGYDLHSDERSRLQNRLGELNDALAAFGQTMDQLGRSNDYVVMISTEFGRTHENGSQGNDHGHCQTMLVYGGAVNGGIKTPTPSNSYIQSQGSYFRTHEIEFQSVIGGVVAYGLGLDAQATFPETNSFFNMFA
ncbi:MAG: DUF1501 domain-containing protein [Bdellovibrionales bacterium]|nr:DUF1501 domain-containing protein [Bdellovibrionales bacterium]